MKKVKKRLTEDLQNLEKYEGNVAGQISQSQEAFANYDEKSAYLDIAVETLLTRKQMVVYI